MSRLRISILRPKQNSIRWLGRKPARTSGVQIRPRDIRYLVMLERGKVDIHAESRGIRYIQLAILDDKRSRDDIAAEIVALVVDRQRHVRNARSKMQICRLGKSELAAAVQGDRNPDRLGNRRRLDGLP